MQKIDETFIEEHVQRGIDLFRQGYNCTQAVTLAMADIYDVPQDLMARMSASFGGGIGRMRETCGTASGMFIMAGLEIATPYPDRSVKAENYAAVQRLAADFKAQAGSLICRELLKGVAKDDTHIPEVRTEEYYKRRPCLRMVELAIRTYLNWLAERRLG